MPYDREDAYTLEIVDLSLSTLVASGGGTDTVELKPPKGFVYQVLDEYINIPDPVGSSANDHRLFFEWAGLVALVAVAYTGYIFSNTGSIIRVRYGLYEGTTEVPTGAAQTELIEKTTATYDQPFNFRYINNTDANQTGTRDMVFLVKKFREAV